MISDIIVTVILLVILILLLLTGIGFILYAMLFGVVEKWKKKRRKEECQ